ncbi:hypothetical protein ADL12_08995 [Streptomyces regalis]|uniref:Uncharacterized protein n=1 Tax=Streptomyces regalis TaxID=68262 RepID=A0A0X3VDE2_9ACTN|nr:hypothetical protein ADL12_08995 [Streptomyces regalis]
MRVAGEPPGLSPGRGLSRSISAPDLLLEQHELAARHRVDGLREEADRIQAEPAAAEQEWQEWAIARRRVDTMLTPDDGITAETEVTEDRGIRTRSRGPGMWPTGAGVAPGPRPSQAKSPGSPSTSINPRTLARAESLRSGAQ